MQPGGPMMYEAFGFWQLVFVLVWVVLVVVPVAMVLRRVGFSGWWSLLVVIAPLNLVALWIFALIDWPRLPKRAGEEGA